MSSVTNLILKAADAESSTCDSQLPAEPWEVDQTSSYGPGASHGDDFPTAAPRQGVLPERYTTATPDELDAMIIDARETLGDRVKILGHFYQRDEIVKFADFVGDSFNLAQAAKAHPEAEAFVFCGVHFMAETADILSQDDQAVILPNLSAGCSMADMANISQVEACWEELSEVLGTNSEALGTNGDGDVAAGTEGKDVDVAAGDVAAKAPQIGRAHV